MVPDNWPIIIPVISLCALVLVARYRVWLQREDADGYRNAVIGLSLFAVTNLISLYQGYGLFERIPFLNDPLFFSLVTWIAVLTGLIFLASGVSSFLPLAREQRRYNRTIIGRLELLKEIEQLVGVETRPDTILAGVVNHIAGSYPLRAGAAYSYSNTTGLLKNVGTLAVLPIAASRLEQMSIEPQRVLRDPQTFLRKHIAVTGQVSAQNLPSFVLPVFSGEQLYGVLLLWFEKGFTPDDSSRMNLKLAAEIAGRSISANDQRRQATCQLNYCQLASAMTQTCAPNVSVKDAFRSMAQCLCSVLGAKTVTLVLLASDHRWHRLSAGCADTVLHEKGVKLQNISVMARQAHSDCAPVYHRSCRSADMIRSGRGTGEGSLMALPIIRNGTSIGVVSLISDKISAFDQLNPDALAQSVSCLGELIWPLNRETTRETAQRRQQLVRAFLRDAYSELSNQEIFEDLARVASIGVDNDIVRVSTFDRARQFLNSRALLHKTSGTRIAPKKASLILDLLPTHKLLLDGRRTVVVDNRHTPHGMSEAEMAHIFGRSVASAALAPVVYEGDVVGVISVARIDGATATEFTEFDTSFLEMIAASASLAIRQASLDRGIRRSRMIPRPETGMRSRIKSSLSGIVGSVEMIRTHGGIQDDMTKKYLEIIDRSARRLGETVEETTV